MVSAWWAIGCFGKNSSQPVACHNAPVAKRKDENDVGFSRRLLVLRTVRLMLLLAISTLIVASVWAYRVVHFDPDHINYHDEGQLDARRDLKNDKLIIKLTGMGFQAEVIYKEILEKDYGIELDRVASCEVEAALGDYVDGYNEVMSEVIDKRFGKDILEKSLVLAEQKLDAQIRAVTERPGKALIPYHRPFSLDAAVGPF